MKKKRMTMLMIVGTVVAAILLGRFITPEIKNYKDHAFVAFNILIGSLILVMSLVRNINPRYRPLFIICGTLMLLSGIIMFVLKFASG